MVHHILVASYTNDIYTLAFDPEAPSLTVISSTAVGHHPSWITFHPEDHSLVFAGLEQPDGKIVALKYDEAGRGTVVAEASSGGSDPCSLFATKDELFIANYTTGALATLPVSPRAPYLLAPAPTSTAPFSGSGPNAARQEAPHPHQVVLHEPYGEVLMPDLGADVVRRFVRVEKGESGGGGNGDDDGAWQEGGHVQHEAGGGPRHVAFHDGDLYTVLELSNRLVKHRFPRLPHAPALVASTPTTSSPPPPPPAAATATETATETETSMLAAEILIPPALTASFPTTPYVYVSNRTFPTAPAGGDSIAVFSTALELVAEVRTGLVHVRGMAVEGRWLVAGGASAGGVKVFERVEDGRGLREVVGNADVEAPTGFLWR